MQTARKMMPTMPRMITPPCYAIAALAAERQRLRSGHEPARRRSPDPRDACPRRRRVPRRALLLAPAPRPAAVLPAHGAGRGSAHDRLLAGARGQRRNAVADRHAAQRAHRGHGLGPAGRAQSSPGDAPKRDHGGRAGSAPARPDRAVAPPLNEASTVRTYNTGVFDAHLHDIAAATLAFLGVTAAASMLPLAALGAAL